VILGRGRKGTASGLAGRATLDSLLRRAAEIRPAARALTDAPNRPHLIGGEPRQLSWAELDGLVDALAGRLRDMGLPTDAVVATQFALSSDAVITLLALMRAGLVAAPIPLGWGRRETTAHLQRIGARAILTAGRAGPVDCADMMRFAAAETFSVRFVLSLGGPSLDGVIPLDDVLANAAAAERVEVARPDNPADHVAVVTADAVAEGHIAVARSHNELIAGGLAAFMAGVPDEHSVFAATLAPDCFAGLALQIVPWLMSGGTLVAHPPLALRIVLDRLAPDGATHAVLPAAAAAAIVSAPLARRPSLRHLALFSRRPVETEAFAEAVAEGLAVDVFLGIGETAVARALKDGAGAIMLGPDTHTSGSGQSPVLVESRVGAEGRLELRGAMVPRVAFPPGAENGVPPYWSVDEDGFRDTGLPAAADKARKSLSIGSREPGVVSIGGRRFAEAALRAAYVEAGGEIAPVIRPDPLLGDRVSGVVGDGRAIAGLAGRLIETGVTPLAIPGGTRQAGQLPFEDTRPREPEAILDPLGDAHSALAQLLSVARAAAGY
jgi:acyl-CoA synthetase (AMP-forming)/AMP-acid ligase II